MAILEGQKMMERLEKHLGRKSSWYVAAASLVYFALTGVTANRRPLWYDELFTFHVSRQEQVAEVLSSLAAGTDIHPPLDYLLRHYSMRLL
ncbi:MAG TPA: hypothetical protein VN898_03730, partial [Candidatus Binatia bacterium]|nr:hypothetical protein [Candidatus Binatia bacterium]